MKKITSFLAAHALLCASLARVPAQTPTPRPAPQPTPQQQQQPPAQPAAAADEDDEVVRITTNLVQIDAVVTGKDGRQVTDLKAEDFEILEDGKPQQITNFSYVSAVPAGTPASPAAAAAGAVRATPPAPTRTRRGDVRRSIALVVDDDALPGDATHPTRDALRKFVDQQVQQGDLVAVIRMSGQVGILQQFTADRRLLYEAIDLVRPSLLGFGGMSAFEGRGRDSAEGGDAGGRETPAGRPGGGGGAGDTNAGGERARDAASFRDRQFLFPLFRALGNIVGGMRGLPGRKSMILFSPGFALSTDNRDEARHLAELANRASVVIYTVDPRGLAHTGPTAAAPMGGLSGRQMGERLSERTQFLYRTQGGAQFLADETGGLAFRNSNDLLPAARILEDLKGYYLIGYRPGGATFNRRFHKLTVRVRHRPELSVRTRTGFSGLTEEEARPAPFNSADRLLLALMSPFAAQEIGVRLTPVFNNLPAEGSFLRALLHIDAGALTFTPEAGGWQRAELVIHGVLFGDNGQVAEEHRQTYTLRLRGDSLKSAQTHGLDYAFNMPAKRPGAYQFRVALLDPVSSRVGSAGQPVEVPELKKDRIALSGIIVSGGGPSAQPPQAQSGAAGTQDTQATPAVRRFRRDAFLDYHYVVFNPRADKATGRPRLSARAKLFRDGRLVFDGPERPIQPESQPDPARVAAGGRLQLGGELPPGDYFIQIVVTDLLAPEGRRTAAQWIDFELVK